jgi:hypothetical protein
LDRHLRVLSAGAVVAAKHLRTVVGASNLHRAAGSDFLAADDQRYVDRIGELAPKFALE